MVNEFTSHEFDCQMYVSARGAMSFGLTKTLAPRRLIHLEAVEYDELIEPGFRRLLAAFESLPQPLRTVQV